MNRGCRVTVTVVRSAPNPRKPAGDLLLGETWVWGRDRIEVCEVMNVYEDSQDTGMVKIRGRLRGRMHWWTLEAEQSVEVEA
jgi:hypothetical protein